MYDWSAINPLGNQGSQLPSTTKCHCHWKYCEIEIFSSVSESEWGANTPSLWHMYDIPNTPFPILSKVASQSFSWPKSIFIHKIFSHNIACRYWPIKCYICIIHIFYLFGMHTKFCYDRQTNLQCDKNFSICITNIVILLMFH